MSVVLSIVSTFQTNPQLAELTPLLSALALAIALGFIKNIIDALR